MFTVWFGSWYGDWFGQEVSSNDLQATLIGSGTIIATLTAVADEIPRKRGGGVVRRIYKEHEEELLVLGVF